VLTENTDDPLILVVEDDDDHSGLVQRAFNDAHEGFRLEIAGTLLDAWKVIERHPPDLVLADYRLPDGDGNELVVMVQRSCPVIIMTSQGSEQVAVASIKAGARDYIVKSPDTFSSLPRIVKLTLQEWSLVQERRRIHEAVSRAKREWEQTFDAVPDLISIIDTGFTITRVNRAMAKRCGLRPEELPGRKCYEVYHNMSSPPPYCPHVRMVLEGREQTAEVEETTLGGFFDVTVAPLYDDNGTIMACVHVSRDITERKKAEAEMQELEKQLELSQRMESVGRLAGGVAHDFNNMLGVIIGHVELAFMESDPTLPIHANLLEIRKAAERSANLTRQLLAFARRQTIVPVELNLNDIVGGMIKMLQRLIGEDVDLNWSPQAGLWPVKMDPSQVDQILANLCVNARDSIADVGKITIETENCSIDSEFCAHHAGFVPGEYVRLTVSDNGCGMDRDTLAHIFEPFFTTKETGKGTGLGLATVYGIVKQNNGFINVYSEPDQGTTFTIYLPRVKGEIAQEPMQDAAKPPVRGHETILLVEDEPAILRMTTMMLEKQGYTVLASNSPEEAIRLASEHASEIHLLMTDVVMPGMNGRDLASNLMSLYPHLRRLFMSGYTADVIARHGVLDEGVHFIQKPFTVKELTAKLREALNGA